MKSLLKEFKSNSKNWQMQQQFNETNKKAKQN